MKAKIASLITNKSGVQDSITILVCGSGHTATKRFHKEDGEVVKTDFNAGYIFGVMVKPVANIRELSATLKPLESIPGGLVIRGAPLNHVNIDKPWRRLKDNFKTPSQGRWWVLLDFDKIKLPDHLSLTADSAAALEYLVGLLPVEFREASYHWQLSSSAGMADPSLLSAHIWFWFNRPVTDLELRELAKYVNDQKKCKLIDGALFRDVQPHYTAAPIFENIENPFPIRSGLVEKKHDYVIFPKYMAVVPVNSIVSSPIAHTTKSTATRRSLQQHSLLEGTKFDAHLASIGDHAGGNGFHEPIIRAIASYVAINGKDGTDNEVLYDLISERVLCADSSQHPDKNYIERMASRGHIIPAIQTAILKYGNTANTRKKSQLIEGVLPPKRGKRISVADAYTILASNIARWL